MLTSSVAVSTSLNRLLRTADTPEELLRRAVTLVRHAAWPCMQTLMKKSVRRTQFALVLVLRPALLCTQGTTSCVMHPLKQAQTQELCLKSVGVVCWSRGGKVREAHLYCKLVAAACGAHVSCKAVLQFACTTACLAKSSAGAGCTVLLQLQLGQAHQYVIQAYRSAPPCNSLAM
jgi:hypothetical protein